MKKTTLFHVLFFLWFNSFAQIRIGDTIPGFYHATYSPVHKLQDTIYDYIYQNTNDVISIDIDNDGMNDLSLISSYFISNSGSFNYPVWRSRLQLDSLTEAITINGSPMNDADTLHVNDSISNANNWSDINVLNGHVQFCQNINNYTLDSTWKDKNTNYVGLRICKAAGDTLYGWLSIGVEDYSIIYLKEHACQSLNPKDTIISLNTSINIYDNFSSNVIQVYPNPFSYLTMLKSKNYLKNATLMIDNCFGQTVKKINNLSGQTINLHRDNLPGGFYFIRLIQSNNVTAVVKLLITDN